jgi:hypothetical protein
MKEQLVHSPRTELDIMESNRDIATGGDDGLEKELKSVEEEITYKMLYKHSKRVSHLYYNMCCIKKHNVHNCTVRRSCGSLSKGMRKIFSQYDCQIIIKIICFFAYKLYFPKANSGDGFKKTVLILCFELQQAAEHCIAGVTDKSSK